MPSSRRLAPVCGISSFIVVFASQLFCSPRLAAAGGASSNAASASLRTAQLFFERNDGQVDHEVLYLSRTSRYGIFLTRTGITIVLLQPEKYSGASSPTSSFFRLTFETVNSQAQVSGVEQLPGISNYFTGSDPKHWHARIPQSRSFTPASIWFFIFATASSHTISSLR